MEWGTADMNQLQTVLDALQERALKIAEQYLHPQIIELFKYKRVGYL